jgi:AcrR family transcriptional regulator
MDAATDVFGTRGFTAATMADVVAASGASIGSIYHHFGGKSELFLAIFEQMANAVDRRIAAAMEEAATGADRGASSSCTCGPTSKRCESTDAWRRY